MNMAESVRICFSKYTDFKGTATRSEFWWFYLFTILANLAGSILDSILHIHNGFISNVATFALILPLIAVEVRRMHDVGKSGWWILVPFYNLYLLVQPSKQTSEF